MGFKRQLVDLFERIINARIVRRGAIGPLFEEEHLRRVFEHFKVDCVFDVGANAGQYAGMVRSRAAYKGPIISFEPNPRLAAILREKARHDPGWFVEEAALGSTAGRATLNVTAQDHFSSLHTPKTTETSLFAKATAILCTVDINISTIEAELSNYRKKLGFERPFLKMDTQGHDVEVALGAGEMLSEFVGFQSELAIRRIYDDTVSYCDALKFYADRGFVLSAFVPNNAGHFPYLIETDCIMLRKDLIDETI